jgi:SAM-dependent methyltransferase
MSVKKLAQQQFGAHAADYVTSETHARGSTLAHLLEAIAARPGQHALDIATGGGHTALGLAEHGTWTVAGDLTLAMLRAARQHIAAQHPARVDYVQLDAEALPFPAAVFDIVACRIAPHHFPQVAQFVREAARVTRSGGVTAVVDELVPGDPKTARYINAFERLRDPSHVWSYNRVEWEGFFRGAGLALRGFEAIPTSLALTPWAERMGCDAATIARLRAMLRHAPPSVAAWMQPHVPDAGEATFVLWQFVLLGEKA